MTDPRIVPALGFAVPSALAAWIVFGVEAHAATRELRPPWAPTYGAYLVHTQLVRHCEPQYPTEIICECWPIIEIAITADRVRAFVVDRYGEAERVAPLSVPRHGKEWTALWRWLAHARTVPMFEGLSVFQLHADGASYRDVIRAIEVADHAGFDEPRLIPARAAESTRTTP